MDRRFEKPGLRVLHCSDFHFDSRLRDDALDVVRELVALRRSLDAEVVLLAGDIFDSTYQPVEFVADVAEGLLGLRVPIIAIPGNHDVVYDQHDPASQLFALIRDGSVYISSPEGRSVVTAGGRLRVWGRGMPEHSPANDPLAGLEIAENDIPWNVAMAHGEIEATRSRLILSSATDFRNHDSALRRIDYLAMGHHHHLKQSAYGRTIVRYSGSPSLLIGTGEVTLIEFSSENGLTVSSHPVRVS